MYAIDAVMSRCSLLLRSADGRIDEPPDQASGTVERQKRLLHETGKGYTAHGANRDGRKDQPTSSGKPA
jgi:hypothetical protein